MLTVLAITTASLQACFMPRSLTVYPMEDALQCLRAAPLTDDVFARTQFTMSHLAELNAFADIARDPPEPYKHLATDVWADLDAINSTFSTGNHSAWDYHAALSEVFLKLKDAHTLYVKPSFFANFILMFPLGIKVDTSGVMRFASYPPRAQFVSESYATLHPEVNLSHLVGRAITRINGKQPLVFLAEWADKYMYISKSSHGRVNAALIQGFFQRPMHVFNFPAQEDWTNTFTVEGQDVQLSHVVFSYLELFDDRDATAAYEKCVYNSTKGNAEVLHGEDLLTGNAGDLLRRASRDFYADVFDTHYALAAPVFERTKDSVDLLPEKLGSNRFRASNSTSDELLRLAGDDMFSLYRYTSNATEADNSAVFVLSIVSFSPHDPNATLYGLHDALQMVRDGNATHFVISVVSNGGGYVSLGHILARAISPTQYPLYGAYNIRRSKAVDSHVDGGSMFTSMKRTHLYNGSIITKGETDEETSLSADPTDWYFKDFQAYPEIDSGVYHGKKNVTFSQTYAFDDDEVTGMADGLALLYAFPGLDLSPDRIILVTDANCGSTCSCFAKHLAQDRRLVTLGVGGTAGLSPDDYAHGAEPYDVASFAGGAVMDSRSFEYAYASMKYLMNLTEKRRPLHAEMMDNISMPTDAYHRFAFMEMFSWNIKRDPVGSYSPLEYIPVPVDIVLPLFPTSIDWQGPTGLFRFLPDVYGVLKTIEATHRNNQCPAQYKGHAFAPQIVEVLAFENDAVSGFDKDVECVAPSSDANRYGRYLPSCNQTCVFYDCEFGYYVDPFNASSFSGDICVLRVDNHAHDNYPLKNKYTGLTASHYVVYILFAAIVMFLIFVVVHNRCPKAVNACFRRCRKAASG